MTSRLHSHSVADAPVTHNSASDRAPTGSVSPRRVPDLMLIVALVLAVIVLAVTITIGTLVYRNPTAPPLTLPTASSL